MGINYWDSAYESGHVPWDPGPYDGHVPRLVEELGIEPCDVLDIGCGTGVTLMWLAAHGFHCTGIESAPTALKLAEREAKKRKLSCRWLFGTFPKDFRETQELSGGYRFVIDRGVFHLHTGRGEQAAFVRGVSRALAPGGVWYSLIASAAHGRGWGGPPRWSEREVRRAVEGDFTIERLEDAVFTPGEEGSMAAWVAIMRKPA